MKFISLQIPGAYRIDLAPHEDERGFFVRTYDEALFKQQDLLTHWVQESHSFSAKKGTLRGLHLQVPPHGESKLVRAGQGSIFMVLLDLRKDSPMFCRWESLVLSIERPSLLYTPESIAMGMCTLTDDCSLLYKMDAVYEPTSARTIRWNDPGLAIPWPADDPIVSDKDKAAPLLKDFLVSEGFGG